MISRHLNNKMSEILLFVPRAVQIYIFRKNLSKRNKVTKYIKKPQKNPQILTRSSWYLKRAAKKIWRQKKIFAECRGMALGKRGLCRVPKIRHSAKRVFNFFKKKSSLPSAFISKKNSLPSAVSGALGKVFSKKKIFVECRSGTLGKEFF